MKTKINFSPGPWKYDTTSGYIETIEGGLVAIPRSGGHLPGQFETNTRANAALISAAPDLYLALNKAYLDILNIINEGEFKEGIEWNSGYIEDALKKARGEK